jgi:hypothetical protein
MTISGRGVPLRRWKYCALAIFPVNPRQQFAVTQRRAHRQQIGALLRRFRQLIDDSNYKSRVKCLIKTGLLERGLKCVVMGLTPLLVAQNNA